MSEENTVISYKKGETILLCDLIDELRSAFYEHDELIFSEDFSISRTQDAIDHNNRWNISNAHGEIDVAKLLKT